LNKVDNQLRASEFFAVSVVIPVYNEEKSVAAMIEAVHSNLVQTNAPFEIIAVNDGSMDKTGSTLADIKACYPKLTILEHETNAGYGAALKTGISRSAYDRILIVDADQTYPTEEIPRLLELSGRFDMVVGSREGPEVQIPLNRRPAKLILKSDHRGGDPCRAWLYFLRLLVSWAVGISGGNP
jgi:glycosyltransferase involved in cell wall biosynthesis